MKSTTQSKWKPWHKVLFAIFASLFFIMVLIILFGSDENSVPNTELTQAQKDSTVRRQKIEEAFSKWDGSHVNLVNYVKKKLNDPSSFEHVQTTFRDYGDSTIFIIMDYRAKNGFGALMKASIKAEAKLDGTLLSVTE